MIAQLTTASPAQHYPEFLQALQASGFRGPLSADYATRTVLANGLGLLGVGAPERM